MDDDDDKMKMRMDGCAFIYVSICVLVSFHTHGVTGECGCVAREIRICVYVCVYICMCVWERKQIARN